MGTLLFRRAQQKFRFQWSATCDAANTALGGQPGHPRRQPAWAPRYLTRHRDPASRQVRYPEIQVVFADSRKFAEEWTYRFLAAALADSMGADVSK